MLKICSIVVIIALLLDQTAANKKELFSELYKRYQPGLFFYAYGLLDNYQDAEDIVTESFIKFWNGAEIFNTPEAAGAWLRTTTRNACYDLGRLKKTRKLTEFNAEMSEDDEDHEYAQMQGELLMEIYNAVEALPEKSREVFRLKYIEGLRNEEISERMGTSYQTVRNQLSAALKVLRLRFADQPCLIPVFLLFVKSQSLLNQKLF